MSASSQQRAATGKLEIYFCRMGQGDCNIIKCPTGEVYIVDMGTSEPEPYPNSNDIYSPRGLLESDDLFGKDKTLNGLILTHSDKDHYNQLGLLYILDITIEKVYHSNLLDSFIQGTDYGQPRSGQAYMVLHRMCLDANQEPDPTKIRGVTYTDRDQLFTTMIPPPKKAFTHTQIVQGNGIDQYTKARGIKIHDNGNCQIYILVGNYDGQPIASDNRAAKRQKQDAQNNYEVRRIEALAINMASIVTLIEFKGDKFLICGDAVGETEKFVIDTYPDVKNVKLLHAPHHGSDTHDSSSLDFVTQMNPNTLVVCAPKKGRQQDHPRCETIQRYVDNCASLAQTRSVNYGCYYKSDADPLTITDDKGKGYGLYYSSSSKNKAKINITGCQETGFEFS